MKKYIKFAVSLVSISVLLLLFSFSVNVGEVRAQLTGVEFGKVKVISPNGGENYKIGDKIHVLWVNKSTSETIALGISSEDFSRNLVSEGSLNNSGSTGSYYFTIPKDTPVGKYIVRISTTNTVGVTDSSDNPFTISAPTTTPTTASTTPSLKVNSSKLDLIYDNNSNESSLYSVAQATLTAGDKDLYFYRGQGYFNLIDNKTGQNVYTNSSGAAVDTLISPVLENTKDTQGLPMYIVRAGRSVQLTLRSKMDPKQLFAGSYSTNFSYLYANTGTNFQNNYLLYADKAVSNPVIVIGEKGPYLVSFEGGNVLSISKDIKVNAERIGNSALFVDGHEWPYNTPAKDGKSFTFPSADSYTSTTNHYIYLVDPVNGKSNYLYFSYKGATPTSPNATPIPTNANITSLSKKVASPGDEVIVYGSGFSTKYTNYVSLNNKTHDTGVRALSSPDGKMIKFTVADLSQISAGEYLLTIENTTGRSNSVPFTIVKANRETSVTATPDVKPVSNTSDYKDTTNSFIVLNKTSAKLQTNNLGSSYQINLSFEGGTASKIIGKWVLELNCPPYVSAMTVPGEACGRFEMSTKNNYGNVLNKEFSFTNKNKEIVTIPAVLSAYDISGKLYGKSTTAIRIPSTSGVNQSIQTTVQGSSQTTVQTSATRRSQIEYLYNTLLRRTSDASGLNYWDNSGMTIDQIRQGLMNTTEYQNLYRTATPTPTVSSSPTYTPSYTPTYSPSYSPTPTVTYSPSYSASPSSTSTASPTYSPSYSPSSSGTSAFIQVNGNNASFWDALRSVFGL